MGSIIGALALEDGAVTDVGLDVSAKHLRIFAENNAWYAQDLGSTNGTHLIEQPITANSTSAPAHPPSCTPATSCAWVSALLLPS